jgi:hypothetical protein
VDAIDDRGRTVDLAALEPGEAMVRALRGTLRYPPDHVATVRASRALCHYTPKPGAYHGHAPNDRQAECLGGAA